MFRWVKRHLAWIRSNPCSGFRSTSRRKARSDLHISTNSLRAESPVPAISRNRPQPGTLSSSGLKSGRESFWINPSISRFSTMGRINRQRRTTSGSSLFRPPRMESLACIPISSKEAVASSLSRKIFDPKSRTKSTGEMGGP